MTPEERERRKRELATAAAILLLLRRAKKLFEGLFRRVALPVVAQRTFDVQAAQSVAQVTRHAVRAIRKDAREKAREAWEKNTGLVAAATVAALAATAVDEERAQRASLSLSRQWEEALTEADGDEDLAADAFVSSLERTAVTEAVDAWADETAMQADDLPPGFVVREIWCARLDACRACAKLNGESLVRPARFEQPPLHPNCRCFVLIEVAAIEAA